MTSSGTADKSGNGIRSRRFDCSTAMSSSPQSESDAFNGTLQKDHPRSSQIRDISLAMSAKRGSVNSSQLET